MSPQITREDADRRFQEVRVMGWFRWALGVFTAIIVTLLIVTVTVSGDQRAGCKRSATERLATAKKDAFDSRRESRLSTDPNVPNSVRKDHADSARAAAEAALRIADLTGAQLVGSEEQKLTQLRSINEDAASTQKAENTYCENHVSEPFPFIK